MEHKRRTITQTEIFDEYFEGLTGVPFGGFKKGELFYTAALEDYPKFKQRIDAGKLCGERITVHRDIAAMASKITKINFEGKEWIELVDYKQIMSKRFLIQLIDSQLIFVVKDDSSHILNSVGVFKELVETFDMQFEALLYLLLQVRKLINEQLIINIDVGIKLRNFLWLEKRLIDGDGKEAERDFFNLWANNAYSDQLIEKDKYSRSKSTAVGRTFKRFDVCVDSMALFKQMRGDCISVYSIDDVWLEKKLFHGIRKGDFSIRPTKDNRPTLAEWKKTSLFDQRMAAGKLCSESPAVHRGIETLCLDDDAAFSEYMGALTMQSLDSPSRFVKFPPVWNASIPDVVAHYPKSITVENNSMKNITIDFSAAMEIREPSPFNVKNHVGTVSHTFDISARGGVALSNIYDVSKEEIFCFVQRHGSRSSTVFNLFINDYIRGKRCHIGKDVSNKDVYAIIEILTTASLRGDNELTEYIDGLSFRCWKFRYDGGLSESANVTKHAVQPRTPYSMPEFTMNCPALSSLIPATHLTFTSFDCFLKTYYDMQSLPNSEIHAINELGGITLYPVVKNNQEAIAYEGLISFFNEQQEIAVKELAEWQALNDESIACDNNCNELTRSYLITKSERAAAYQLSEAARKRVNEYKRSKLPLLRLKCAVCVESIDVANAAFNKVKLQDSLDDLVREKRLNVLNGDGKWQWQWPGLEFLNEEFEHTRLSASLGLPLSGRFAPKRSTANKTASKRRSTKK